MNAASLLFQSCGGSLENNLQAAYRIVDHINQLPKHCLSSWIHSLYLMQAFLSLRSADRSLI